MKLTAGSSAINFWDDENAFTADHALPLPPQLISVSLGLYISPVTTPAAASGLSAESRSVGAMLRSFCTILFCHSVMALLSALAALAHYYVIFHDPHSSRSPLLLIPALIACWAIMLFTGGFAVIYPAFQYRRSFIPEGHISLPVISLGLVSAASVALAIFASPLWLAGYFAALSVVAALQARHEL